MENFIVLYKSKKSSPVYFYVGLIFFIVIVMSVMITGNPDSVKFFDSIYSYILYVVLGITGFIIFLIMLKPEKYILLDNKIYKHPVIKYKTANYINYPITTPVETLSGSQTLSPGKYSLHGNKTFGTYFELKTQMNKSIFITIMSMRPENENSFTGEKRKKTDYFMDDEGFHKFCEIYNLKDTYVKIKY